MNPYRFFFNKGEDALTDLCLWKTGMFHTITAELVPGLSKYSGDRFKLRPIVFIKLSKMDCINNNLWNVKLESSLNVNKACEKKTISSFKNDLMFLSLSPLQPALLQAKWAHLLPTDSCPSVSSKIMPTIADYKVLLQTSSGT